MDKDKKVFLEKGHFLPLLFFLSIGLCFMMSSFSKSLFLSADEMRYIGIARSIADGRAPTYFHHILTDYQKILYPLCISLAYTVDDLHLQVILVGLINAVLMSSSVFPAYLLAKEYLGSSRQILAVCAFTVLYPECAMTMTFMSENLYFPMVLWEVYIVHRLLKKGDRRLSCLFGVWTYLLYLCKEIGLCFLLGYILAECFWVFQRKKAVRDLVRIIFIPAASFLVLFILAKCTVFGAMGNSYDQTGIDAILSGKAVLYFFYACIYYLVYVVIAFYFFPVLICIFKWSRLSGMSRRMFVFLASMVGVMIGTVGYTISIREDLGSLSPHLHMRYFAPLAVPFFILFLREFKTDQMFTLKRRQRYMVSMFMIMLAVIPNICQRGLMDQQNMEFYRCICIALTKIFGKTGDILSYLVVKPIWLIFLVGGLYWMGKDPKRFLRYFMVSVFALNIVNYVLKYVEVRIFYSIDRETVEEMQELDEELSRLPGEKLLVGKYLQDQTMELADTYLDDPDMYYTSFSAQEKWEDIYPDHVRCTWPSVVYDDMGEIAYFVIDNEIDHERMGVYELVWEGRHFSIWR